MATAKPPPSADVTRAAKPAAGSGSVAGASADSVAGKAAVAGHQSFAAEELAIVLSHYDLGVIEAIQPFPRGSRKAPKLIVRSEKGMYLLKRRARGKDDPYKVAFCHGLQLHLSDRQFPLPHLIGTRRDNNSMLKFNGATYELFEYIKGNSYDQSLEATGESGKTLALFHKLLKDYQPDYEAAKGSFHASKSVVTATNQIPTKLRQTEPETDPKRVGRLAQSLGESYRAAAKAAEALGLSRWPTQIAHADWHPGNMLYRGSHVVAVIDYDAARYQPRIIDAANGALQFSILGGGDDLSAWPDYLDESRFKRFLRGYDEVPESVLSRAEIKAIPPLMIEALIAESVIPIAATGYFARMPGSGFLAMMERKVRWLQENAGKLIAAVDS